MTRNSTRTYWMSNKNWYKIVNGEFQLTPDAPMRARRSFIEWNSPKKLTMKRLIRVVRSKLF